MSITIHHQNKTFEIPFSSVPENANGSYLFGLSQISPRPLCTGIGKCGRCKIKYLNNVPELCDLEKTLLTEEERENNIRLACKHPLQDNLILEINDDLLKDSTACRFDFEKLPSLEKASLCVDLGTTSIAFSVQNGSSVLAEGKILNPQMFAGADVMARLYYAHFVEKENPGRLQTVIVRFLKNLCNGLREKNIEIEKILVSANSAMTALFLGENIQGLMEAPYRLDNKGNCTRNFPGLPPVYIPPQMSAFIGADACSGLAYVRSQYPETDNFLLADLGTNGEFIFYHNGTIHAASIPLGPALEGVGMRCGGAVHGNGENIILGFSLSPTGLSCTCSGKPEFICGAAYLSLINILLSANILDRQGFFRESTSPLAKKITQNIRDNGKEKRLYITENLYLCPEDIENILKIKAAFSSAMELFLQKNSIENIFLSGALGSYIPLEVLENLGFLPKNGRQKTKILGNTSLLGTAAYIQHPALIAETEELCRKAQIIDLTNQKEYNSLYIENMHF